MIAWNTSKYLIQFGFPGHKIDQWFEHVEAEYEGAAEGGGHHIFYIGPFCFSTQWLGEECE